MRTFDWFFENTGWQRDEPLFGVELFDDADDDGPCPCCYDGGGPDMLDDDEEDDA